MSEKQGRGKETVFRDSVLLERPYSPPMLFIAEEAEIGGGYHTLWVVQGETQESDWSEPYKKTSSVQYRRRVVRVPYPPPMLDLAKPAPAQSGGSPFCLDCSHPLTEADRRAPVCPHCGCA